MKSDKNFKEFFCDERPADATGNGDEREGKPEEWYNRLSQTAIYADEIFFNLSAEALKREIVFFMVGTGFDTRVYKPKDPVPNHFSPMYVLYFSETAFPPGHFQSIRPKSNVSSENISANSSSSNGTSNNKRKAKGNYIGIDKENIKPKRTRQSTVPLSDGLEKKNVAL